jgi:hypothetical protein
LGDAGCRGVAVYFCGIAGLVTANNKRNAITDFNFDSLQIPLSARAFRCNPLYMFRQWCAASCVSARMRNLMFASDCRTDADREPAAPFTTETSSKNWNANCATILWRSALDFGQFLTSGLIRTRASDQNSAVDRRPPSGVALLALPSHWTGTILDAARDMIRRYSDYGEFCAAGFRLKTRERESWLQAAASASRIRRASWISL